MWITYLYYKLSEINVNILPFYNKKVIKKFYGLIASNKKKKIFLNYKKWFEN